MENNTITIWFNMNNFNETKEERGFDEYSMDLENIVDDIVDSVNKIDYDDKEPIWWDYNENGYYCNYQLTEKITKDVIDNIKSKLIDNDIDFKEIEF